MICHHGARYSALSVACFAKEVADMTSKECGLLALDARRHGEFAGKLRFMEAY
jgi:protein phosphatase methylesterase 1